MLEVFANSSKNPRNSPVSELIQCAPIGPYKTRRNVPRGVSSVLFLVQIYLGALSKNDEPAPHFQKERCCR